MNEQLHPTSADEEYAAAIRSDEDEGGEAMGRENWGACPFCGWELSASLTKRACGRCLALSAGGVA